MSVDGRQHGAWGERAGTAGCVRRARTMCARRMWTRAIRASLAAGDRQARGTVRACGTVRTARCAVCAARWVSARVRVVRSEDTGGVAGARAICVQAMYARRMRVRTGVGTVAARTGGAGTQRLKSVVLRKSNPLTFFFCLRQTDIRVQQAFPISLFRNLPPLGVLHGFYKCVVLDFTILS